MKLVSKRGYLRGVFFTIVITGKQRQPKRVKINYWVYKFYINNKNVLKNFMCQRHKTLCGHGCSKERLECNMKGLSFKRNIYPLTNMDLTY